MYNSGGHTAFSIRRRLCQVRQFRGNFKDDHALLLLLISLRHRPNMPHALDASPLAVIKILIGQRSWGKSNKFLTQKKEENLRGINIPSRWGRGVKDSTSLRTSARKTLTILTDGFIYSISVPFTRTLSYRLGLWNSASATRHAEVLVGVRGLQRAIDSGVASARENCRQPASQWSVTSALIHTQFWLVTIGLVMVKCWRSSGYLARGRARDQLCSAT